MCGRLWGVTGGFILKVREFWFGSGVLGEYGKFESSRGLWDQNLRILGDYGIKKLRALGVYEINT